MKKGYLSQYFNGVAMKVLSPVEIDVSTSHQHEFNGVSRLKEILGPEKRKFAARFLYLDDNDSDPLIEDGYLTWYDARERHPNRSEYRLYFPTTTVSQCAAAGDSLFIAVKPDGTLLVVIAENGSTIGNQLRWLFGIDNQQTFPGFSVREELETEQDRIAFASTLILEQIGIVVEVSAETYLEEMLRLFDGGFPKTKDFSAYARSTLSEMLDSMDNPDDVLMRCMEREEVLFRTLERHLVADRLSNGFEDNIDGFLAYSLSVQNRRKSRVGFALENHLEYIFNTHKIRFDRNKVTENKTKPDFIFPCIEKYHQVDFNVALLTMLGVKSTCKDRWRQVLSEAEKIPQKHLLTLEPSISQNQTDEMLANSLQLVVPRGIFDTYSPPQQSWLMNVSAFLELVQERQRRAVI